MNMTLVQQLDYMDNCVIRFQLGELTADKAIYRIQQMATLEPILANHARLNINDIKKASK